jgi:Phage gp6-like head-tail connector protein
VAVMDKDSIKNMLGIKTEKHDMYLDEVIPLFIDHAKEYCNNQFDGDLPSGVRIYVAKAIEFNMNPTNLKGRKMGEVSYSYQTEFPRSILKYLAPYRKVRFKCF